MGVTCQILIKKPKEGAHKPGRPVSGIVKYNIDKPTEYKRITLSLTGKGECRWTETTGTGSDEESKTYRGSEEYVSAHMDLLDKKKTDTVVIDTGSYQSEFEFILPNEIPPSFKDYTGSIIYKLTLKFEKPGVFARNKEFDTVIPVATHLESTAPDVPVIFGLEKSLFKPFSQKRFVKLKAQIAKATFAPGENVQLSFEFTNDTNVNITSIKTELVSYVTYTANCGRTKHSQSMIAESVVESPSVPKDAVANLFSVISTVPELYSIMNSKVISREYKLKVTVRLPMPYVNPSVEMPILIIERNIEILPEHDDDDQPPSYWEAVCEEHKICQDT